MVIEMDLLSINILSCALSAGMMLTAVIYMLTYIVGSYSSKSGLMSLKVVLISLLYFFGSTIFIYMGIEWFSDLARTRTQQGFSFFLNVGAGALAMNLVFQVLCGFLTALLYLRGRISQGLSLQRILDGIRTRIRSKSKE